MGSENPSTCSLRFANGKPEHGKCLYKLEALIVSFSDGL